MFTSGFISLNIDEKLEQARAKSEDYGRKYGAKEVSDDRLKGLYARLRDGHPLGVKATVPAIDSWVRNREAYKEGITQKENAYADWKTCEIDLKLLMLEAEVWRSKEATNRWMDQSHR